MWTCPVCGQAFIRQNQTHSCRERTVADFLAGKPAHNFRLYNKQDLTAELESFLRLALQNDIAGR
jgi:hypothetical protein